MRPLTVASGQDEAIPVEPVGVLGVILHHLVVQDVPHGRAPHGQTRVSGIGLLHGIDGQESDGVHGLLHEGAVRLLQSLHGRSRGRHLHHRLLLLLRRPPIPGGLRAARGLPRDPEARELGNPAPLRGRPQPVAL